MAPAGSSVAERDDNLSGRAISAREVVNILGSGEYSSPRFPSLNPPPIEPLSRFRARVTKPVAGFL